MASFLIFCSLCMPGFEGLDMAWGRWLGWSEGAVRVPGWGGLVRKDSMRASGARGEGAISGDGHGGYGGRE